MYKYHIFYIERRQVRTQVQALTVIIIVRQREAFNSMAEPKGNRWYNIQVLLLSITINTIRQL